MSGNEILDPPQGLNRLPDELILMIMKNLAPPAEMSENTHSLVNLRGPKNRAYIYGLVNIGATNRRFHRLAKEDFLADFTFGICDDLWDNDFLDTPMQTFGVHRESLTNELGDKVPREVMSRIRRLALDHQGMLHFSKTWMPRNWYRRPYFDNVRHLTLYLTMPTSCAWRSDYAQSKADRFWRMGHSLYTPKEEQIGDFADQLVSALPALETIEMVRRTEELINSEQWAWMYEGPPSPEQPILPLNAPRYRLSEKREHLDELVEHDAVVMETLQRRLEILKTARAESARQGGVTRGGWPATFPK